MELKNIYDVAREAGIDEKYVEPYGKDKAKIDLSIMNELDNREDGKLVLVTAITPTKAGEGKTTTSISLAEGLGKIGQKAMLVLREPSLGPVFGIKGGATGGGKATIEPSEDINLHFTGDMHALTSSINLIAAIIDNSLYRGNPLHIDADRILWSRAIDMNDRALRDIVVGLGEGNGVERSESFTITVASELMAILCLATDELDFIDRVNRIIVAYTFDDEPVYLRDLRISHAIFRLMRHALKPNLVQTVEGNPCLVHGGPFANIAHGCNSINATICALATGDYVVTEAGFAADLGAEKFFDIKCRMNNLKPSACVIVATIRALKMHGGVIKADLSKENLAALEKGFENLQVHIENIKKFGVEAVVAVNKFITDSDAEIELLTKLCEKIGAKAVLSEGWEKGGEGAKELAKVVCEIADSGKSNFKPLYESDISLKEKIETLAKEIYRAERVEFDAAALKKLQKFEEAGFGSLPICMAKTQNSISHDKGAVGAPKGYTFPVRDVQLYSGAGFVVAFAGEIVQMPGLPKLPAALNIDVDDDGVISGLF